MAVVSNYDCQLHGYKCWQPTPIMSGRNVVFTLAFPHSVKTVFIFRARSYYTCRRLAQRSRKRVSKTSHFFVSLVQRGGRWARPETGYLPRCTQSIRELPIFASSYWLMNPSATLFRFTVCLSQRWLRAQMICSFFFLPHFLVLPSLLTCLMLIQLT